MRTVIDVDWSCTDHTTPTTAGMRGMLTRIGQAGLSDCNRDLDLCFDTVLSFLCLVLSVCCAMTTKVKKKKKTLHFHHFGLLLHSLIFGSCKDLLADQHYTVNWGEVGLPSYSVKYRNPVDGLTSLNTCYCVQADDPVENLVALFAMTKVGWYEVVLIKRARFDFANLTKITILVYARTHKFLTCFL